MGLTFSLKKSYTYMQMGIPPPVKLQTFGSEVYTWQTSLGGNLQMLDFRKDLWISLVGGANSLGGKCPSACLFGFVCGDMHNCMHVWIPRQGCVHYSPPHPPSAPQSPTPPPPREIHAYIQMHIHTSGEIMQMGTPHEKPRHSP